MEFLFILIIVAFGLLMAISGVVNWIHKLKHNIDYRWSVLRTFRVWLIAFIIIFSLFLFTFISDQPPPGGIKRIMGIILSLGVGVILITYFDKRRKGLILLEDERKYQERFRYEKEKQKHFNSTEYKAKQEKMKNENQKREEYLKYYGSPEKGRSQALKIRSMWEFETWMSTFEILHSLGVYSKSDIEEKRYYLRTIEFGSYSSKLVWEFIDENCEKIKELTGIQLRTTEEIRDFKKNEIEKYIALAKFKASKASKLIDISIGILDATTGNYAGIYLIVNNKTFDFYIGESQNMMFRRKTHLGDLLDNNHHSNLLQDHFNKYGKRYLEFHILETNGMSNESVRKYAEKRWINEHKPTYN